MKAKLKGIGEWMQGEARYKVSKGSQDAINQTFFIQKYVKLDYMLMNATLTVEYIIHPKY